MTVTIRHGDCREVLRTMPDKSAHCCVTSPPYYGQRDYGVAGQIGLEPTPAAFVANLLLVFEEVRRVLRDDGTLWLNLGDSFNNRTRVRTSSHKPIADGDRIPWAQTAREGKVRMSLSVAGLKEKDLFGIPWQVAFALRDAGWYIRQEVIWSKVIAKLDVAGDRPATKHEQLFLLSKSKRYHFAGENLPPAFRGSVWSVPATGSKDHGASFPVSLIEPCILASSPVGGMVIDPFGGVGTTGVAADRLGRNATLIELNSDFIATAESRLQRNDGFLSEAAE